MSAKILIVDDAAFMRMMLSDILVDKGHNVVGEAKDGEEALRLYKEMKPNIVTMDIVMPGVGGIESIREIMKIDPEAKILVVSAMGQEALVREAVEAGAKGFVVKPFKPEKVIEEVENILGG
ncbi:MAG: response regulator [Deltaproteobacteria bacterium]|nr:response regulator [Deltaproteobacteria bacterium]MBW2117974.1 response regulator [Deltaproteobacteria bacterium]